MVFQVELIKALKKFSMQEILEYLIEHVSDEKCKNALMRMLDKARKGENVNFNRIKSCDFKELEELLKQLRKSTTVKKKKEVVSPLDPSIRFLFYPYCRIENSEENGRCHVPIRDPQRGFKIPTVVSLEGPAGGGKSLFAKSLLYSILAPKEYGGLVENGDYDKLFVMILDTEIVWDEESFRDGLELTERLYGFEYPNKEELIERFEEEWLLQIEDVEQFFGRIYGQDFNPARPSKELIETIKEIADAGVRPVIIIDSVSEIFRDFPGRENAQARSKAVAHLVKLIKAVRKGKGVVIFTNQIYEKPDASSESSCIEIDNKNKICADRFEMFGGSRLKHEATWRIFVQPLNLSKMANEFAAATLDTPNVPRVAVKNLMPTSAGLVTRKIATGSANTDTVAVEYVSY